MFLMGAKQLDYYIFIDYSENLIGYSIVENNKIKDSAGPCCPKITTVSE